MSQDNVPIISFKNIVKEFPKHTALKNVSFDIHQGEFFGLLGPNGAGKTTLISLLAGLTKATSGSTTVLGYDVEKDYVQARRHVGIVPQELVFDPFFTPREVLRLQSGYYGLKKNDAWIDEVLHHLDLTSKADAGMRTLSGGMKRRVLIAQALVHRPPVIVLDEPTAGVDVELRKSLWTFVQKLNADGHTILLTTHYLEEAEALCTRLALLRKGELLALDKTTNLLKSQAHRISITLSGALPESWHTSIQTQSNYSYTLILHSVEAIEMLLKECRERRLTIYDFSAERPSLEDVFIRMMHN
ncbi:MAG: ABC transporter ATP-binding protein [Pseudomonadota bacterium]